MPCPSQGSPAESQQGDVWCPPCPPSAPWDLFKTLEKQKAYPHVEACRVAIV